LESPFITGEKSEETEHIDLENLIFYSSYVIDMIARTHKLDPIKYPFINVYQVFINWQKIDKLILFLNI
jgi:hypothetical protein